MTHLAHTDGTPLPPKDVPHHQQERVTHSYLQYFALPGTLKPFALITLDNDVDYRKPSTLGPRGLASLDAALEELTAHNEVCGVGITGKPYIFGAGADLTAFGKLRSQEEARAVLRYGHRVFARLRALPVPTFAFLNGVALGGALELALHADYRSVVENTHGVGLPEVSLGLAPGWGGSYLLPHLIGPREAVRVIVQNPLQRNKLLSALDACELGIADVAFEPAEFLTESLTWAARVLRGEITIERRDPAPHEEWESSVSEAQRALSDSFHRGREAPRKALELLSHMENATYADAMGAEEDVVSELILSPQTRASLYAFQLTKKYAKNAYESPNRKLARPIRTAGVIGAGLMATQIALLLARRLRIPVLLTDVDEDRLSAGEARIDAQLETMREKGRITTQEAATLRSYIHPTLSLEEFADADVVIEAVYEDLAVKQQALQSIEEHVSDACVLATNTSSLSVTEIADSLTHPERVVGMHFFNPIYAMPLVEIVRAQQADEASLATGLALGQACKKTCVLVSDSPGFVVNRLLLRVLSQVLDAIDRGTEPEVANTALDALGLPMRPLELLELVGPRIALNIQRILHEKLGERFPVSAALTALVESDAEELAPQRETTGEAPTAEKVRSSVVAALREEINLMRDEGVISSDEEVDVCMLTGAGWPLHLGGITPFLRSAGEDKS